ncbi:DUF3105 domain-containing protein [Kutzneria chonburiensis]|uniref:DUF3105 domain-containing protein n=1 Tax=Kutzneria chonburiensis TaxID=1483604 RepID=A0ABV6MUN6_9PSEU|nr:DUF3105 domain-containing protein [Kutzneria chonburiensis]
MAGGKKKGGAKSAVAAARGAVPGKGKPWGMIIAVLVVLVLAVSVFGYAFIQISDKNAAQAALAQWQPSDTNKDPSTKIQGVVVKDYKSGQHVQPTQRVAYDQSPPFGGPHDGFWADCDGIVYPNAVRSENMVHALEHGTVWIAYNPDKVKGADLDKLKLKVQGKQFMMLSPYPGLDKPISLQSWGHQLKVDNAGDERIDEFISALRTNQYEYPEVGASCDALGPGQFDPNNPPPFDPSKPGPDAVPMAGTGAQDATNEQQPGGTPPSTGTSATTSPSNPK